MGAFSEALAAALRELLSSTLGVPEEGMRDRPLPELVRALQREWEALLEGLVRKMWMRVTKRGRAFDFTCLSLFWTWLLFFLQAVLFSPGRVCMRAALHTEIMPCGQGRTPWTFASHAVALFPSVCFR